MTVQVEHLSCSLGKLEAVKGIDFAVGRGEIFGFLGPNGAGKSTTIKMLCTLLRPGGGRAIVNGYEVERESTIVRQKYCSTWLCWRYSHWSCFQLRF